MIVAGNVDKQGRPVVSVRMRNQDPGTFSALDTTRTLAFIIEWTLRTYPDAQKKGIVLINDLRGVGFKNVDLRIPRELSRAFTQVIPVRVAQINLVNPPMFLKALFSFFSSFLSTKLKARVALFGKGDEARFHQLFDRHETMEDLGMNGTLKRSVDDHKTWIDAMARDCKTWPRSTSYRS